MNFSRISSLVAIGLVVASSAFAAEPAKPIAVDKLAPIMLDDIHYYSVAHPQMKAFFIRHFGAKPMREQPLNPLTFIDFLAISPTESTINLSPKGPFEGIRVGDPKRWEKSVVPPSPTLPAMYGVHWVALSTNDLTKALATLEANGVTVAARNFMLPGQPRAKAASVYTPDFNLLVLVERRDAKLNGGFGIDHIQLLVKSVAENVKFFTDVFRGVVRSKNEQATLMEIGRHLFVLSEPPALGLDRAKVAARDPALFRSTVDHIGFLYENADAAYENAAKLGYNFLLKPTLFKFFDKPTPYAFGITFSPDGLQCEMYTETGRTGPRTQVAN
jgi:catechol 2,3-dioxygenase-like lactoylglutathione lyase family enzyme